MTYFDPLIDAFLFATVVDLMFWYCVFLASAFTLISLFTKD